MPNQDDLIEEEKPLSAEAAERQPATPLDIGGLLQIKEQPTECRTINFGDISLQENLDNAIPDDEFGRYHQNFDLFKRIVGTASTPDEEAFLASRQVFGSIMGLDAERGYFPEEAKILHQALKRTDATENFAMFFGGKYKSGIEFVNVPHAEEILRDNQGDLGLQLPDGKLSKDKLSEEIITLYKSPDGRLRNLAIGLLSGFPKESVQKWVDSATANNHLPEFPLTPLSDEVMRYLDSEDPVVLDPERVAEVYSLPFLQFGEVPPHQAGEKIAISAFGVTFGTTYPASPEVTAFCQKVAELDRRLQVTPYIEETHQHIAARRQLQELPTASEPVTEAQENAIPIPTSPPVDRFGPIKNFLKRISNF